MPLLFSSASHVPPLFLLYHSSAQVNKVPVYSPHSVLYEDKLGHHKPRLPPDISPVPVSVDNKLVRISVFHTVPDLVNADHSSVTHEGILEVVPAKQRKRSVKIIRFIRTLAMKFYPDFRDQREFLFDFSQNGFFHPLDIQL